MDKESPFFNSGEMDLIEPSLLKAVFDKIPASIEVLKAVREGDRVIDFEYILENESAEINAGHHNRPGKKFLTADINNDGHFQKMVEVVETGKEFRTVIDAKLNGGTEWFEKKYIKFGDGLIVFHLNASKKNSSEIPTRDDAHFIKQIVDTSPEIISIMDLDSLQVIYTNRKIATDLGYTKEQTERMKNPLMDIMFKEDIVPFKKHLEEIKALTSDDKVLEFEYRLVNANGGITWLCDRNAVFKRNSRKPGGKNRVFSKYHGP